MDTQIGADALPDLLIAAGLPVVDVSAWLRVGPGGVDGGSDAPRAWASLQPYVSLGEGLVDRLPGPTHRGEGEDAAARAITDRLREVRVDFLRAHAGAVFRLLTDGDEDDIRVEDLVARAADRFPGLTPSAEQMVLESARPLKEKIGREVDQGLFLWQILAHREAGARLVHGMLRPLRESWDLLSEFQRSGRVDLDVAVVSRNGNVGLVEHRNTRYLNAEDSDTNRALEIAVDLVTLDSGCQVGVLRGAPVTHPKYAGRRVFSAGLNLTQLYQGRLPFLFYMTRDLGLVNKIYRGHSPAEFRPDEGETGVEKPWIAAVEAFAIGGGCQLLLVMDYVLAEHDAYFSLPARKEGIIPGAANLRLPRFVGDRMARRGILFDQPFPADSPEARLLCDELVPSGEMDSAIDRISTALSSSGVVSSAGNRKAIRIGQEPLSVFQAYMATYAREQALCHLSPALVHNLERYWLNHRQSNED